MTTERKRVKEKQIIKLHISTHILTHCGIDSVADDDSVDLALHLGLKSQRAAKPTLHPSFKMVDECTPEEDGEGKSMVTQVSYWLAGSLSPQPPRAKGRRGTPPQSSATAYE